MKYIIPSNVESVTITFLDCAYNILDEFAEMYPKIIDFPSFVAVRKRIDENKGLDTIYYSSDDYIITDDADYESKEFNDYFDFCTELEKTVDYKGVIDTIFDSVEEFKTAEYNMFVNNVTDEDVRCGIDQRLEEYRTELESTMKVYDNETTLGLIYEINKTKDSCMHPSVRKMFESLIDAANEIEEDEFSKLPFHVCINELTSLLNKAQRLAQIDIINGTVFCQVDHLKEKASVSNSVESLINEMIQP